MQSGKANPTRRQATVTARAAILRILVREGAVSLTELEQELRHGKSTMYKAIDRLRVTGAVGIHSGKINADSRRSKIVYLKDTSPRLVLCLSDRRMTAYWVRAKGDGTAEGEATPLPLTYTCTPAMTLLENAYVFFSRVADEQLKSYADRTDGIIYPPVLVWDGEEALARCLGELTREVLGAWGMMWEEETPIPTVTTEQARLAGVSYLPGTKNATSAMILQMDSGAAEGWIAARETSAHSWFMTSLGYRLGSSYRDVTRPQEGFYRGITWYLGGVGKWISPDVVIVDAAWHKPSNDEMRAMRKALPKSCVFHVLADTDRLVAYGASQIARLAYYGVIS